MIQDVTIPARLLTCEVCQYEWVSIMRNRLPSHCQNRECRSREWNGKKEKKKPAPKPKIVLPRAVKVKGGEEDEQF